MRFDPADPVTAGDVVNSYPQRRLQEVIRILGGEPWAGPIASAIVRRRRRQKLSTTRELAELVGGVIPRRHWPRRIDPATKTFQAIRMEVNQELDSLRRGLEEIVKHLKPGGRFGVVSFHSLEDKAVKDFLNVEAKDCICPPLQPVCTCHHLASLIIHPPHPLRPGKGEVEGNPRSRSARLRGAIKLPLPEGHPLQQSSKGRSGKRRNDRPQTE
jgi:16S rRNA (cytosine1402-N4)-methyltransferase